MDDSGVDFWVSAERQKRAPFDMYVTMLSELWSLQDLVRKAEAKREAHES